jgi:hypothetical protein
MGCETVPQPEDQMNADQITGCQRFAGQVKRYHTWPVLREQTVAEHTWQIMRIYHSIFGEPSQDIYTFILYHDAGEIATGDLPFPVKMHNPDIKETMDLLEDRALERMKAPVVKLEQMGKIHIKICDLLEMWEYGVQECAMGNQLAKPIVDRTVDAIYDYLSKLAGLSTSGYAKRIRDAVEHHMKEYKECTT